MKIKNFKTHLNKINSYIFKKKYSFNIVNILIILAISISLGYFGFYGVNSFFLKNQYSKENFAFDKHSSNNAIINNSDNINYITSSVEKVYKSVVTLAVYMGNITGEGSGIIIDKSGYIVTNAHVITLDGKSLNSIIEVQLSDGRVYKASVIGISPLADLAVIKIHASDLYPATLGNSHKLNVGDRLIAIGAALGLSGTVTDGIVSNLSRTITVASSFVPNNNDLFNNSENEHDWFSFAPPHKSKQKNMLIQGVISINVIQTDAAINPGNSGGALINTSGEVVGVNVAIASTGDNISGTSGSIGVGFSIPINYVKRITNELIQKGKSSHGYIGISVKPQKSGVVENSNFSIGAKIIEIMPNSPASKIDLHVGDLIVKLDNTRINDPQSLTASIKERMPGEKIKIHFIRNDKLKVSELILNNNMN